jgi:hypothetical protein
MELDMELESGNMEVDGRKLELGFEMWKWSARPTTDGILWGARVDPKS